jgi:hypothetical protein
MTSSSAISADDRDLMKRLTIVLAIVFLLTAAIAKLGRVYSHKFYDTTGEGKWIWAGQRMNANVPLAFFAARDFTLPESRAFAHLKVCGDPEYTVWINGHELAGAQSGPVAALDQYDVSAVVRTGANRMVIAVRAPQGNGGLIASLDISPELENWVVTDERWTIYRTWRPDLLAAHPSDLWSETPVEIGEPPIGRWNYLRAAARELPQPPSKTIPPRESFTLQAQLPTIRTSQGIALAVAEPTEATAFDFGFTAGRVRITLAADATRSRAVKLRLANLREELNTVEWNLRTMVLAPGERTVTTPESHNFRYAMVFGKDVSIDLLR